MSVGVPTQFQMSQSANEKIHLPEERDQTLNRTTRNTCLLALGLIATIATSFSFVFLSVPVAIAFSAIVLTVGLIAAVSIFEHFATERIEMEPGRYVSHRSWGSSDFIPPPIESFPQKVSPYWR